MNFTWGMNESIALASIEDAVSLLDRLDEQARGKGMIVQATHENGCTLAIGVGLDESVLTFFDGHGQPWVSVGERDREDYLTFEFGGDISEMMGAKAVPVDKARAAVRDFFKSGERPALINWEKEWA